VQQAGEKEEVVVVEVVVVGKEEKPSGAVKDWQLVSCRGWQTFFFLASILEQWTRGPLA